MPCGSADWAMVMVGQTGVRVYASVPAQPLASVAFTVKVEVLALLGVPLSTPAEVSVAQEGSEPLDTL